jgi:HD superfamily phosphodiesterase
MDKINQIKKFIKDKLPPPVYLHTMRVYNNALEIQKKEGGDRLVIEAAALLHDAGKLRGVLESHPKEGTKIFKEKFADLFDKERQKEIIASVKFGHPYPPFNTKPPRSLEAQIVADADHLDLIRFAIPKIVLIMNKMGEEDYLVMLQEAQKAIYQWQRVLNTKTAKDIVRPFIQYQNKLFTLYKKQLKA